MYADWKYVQMTHICVSSRLQINQVKGSARFTICQVFSFSQIALIKYPPLNYNYY